MAKELADIIYRNPKTWAEGDAYALYCWFTHALYKAEKYHWYKDKINSIDYNQVSPEACAIIRTVCSQVPGAWDNFLHLATKIIKEKPMPAKVVKISNTDKPDKRLLKQGVWL